MAQDKNRTQYNHSTMEIDALYHELARHYGLSDTAYYIFYVIRLSDEAYTQARLCDELHLSKQTVFSALKRLEADGYVEVRPSAENQKSKNIYLTVKGVEMARQSVDKVETAEENAFRALGERDAAMLNALTAKYVSFLRKEIGGLTSDE